MYWQSAPFFLLLLMAATVSAALALYAWRRRFVSGAMAFVWLMLAGAWWSLAYALELSSVSKSAKLFWVKVEYPGIVTVPVAWLIFVLQYTGQDKRLSRRNLLLLATVPLVTLIMAWTSGMHRWFYGSIRLDTSGSWPVLDLTYRGWFWIHVAYSYLLLLLGTFLLLRMLLRPASLYRGQARVLLIGALIPWLGSVLYIFDLTPFPDLDLTPFAFTITGLVVTWGLFRLQLLNLVPVARDAIIEGMSDGMIVLDTQNRIVDLNPAAERFVGRPAAEIIGRPGAQVLSGRLDLLEPYDDVGQAQVEIALDGDGTQYHYDLRISPLHDRCGHLTGRLVILREVTEQVQMERTLRESEEKYRDLVENISEVIYAVDQNGVITYISPVVESLSGYPPSELIGRSFLEFIYPEDLPGLLESFQKTIGGHRELYECRILAHSDEIHWVRSSSRLIFDGDRIVGLRGSFTDITERRRTEQRLYARERFLTLLNDITRAALETQDLSAMLQILADRLGELFDADGAYITLWDEATRTTIPATAYGEWRESYRAVGPEPGETTVTESVLQAGHPLVIEDVFDTPYLSRRIAELFPDRSLLALPLIAGDQKLGAALIAFNEPHRFFPDEVTRGEQVAGQIALSVAKARLLEETQRRWREAETLRQAGAVITETLNLDETLERILVQLERVVPYDSASVQLLRVSPKSKGGDLEIVGGRGFPEPEVVIGLKIPVPDDNPNSTVIEERKPVILTDAWAAYPPFRRPPHDYICSWLGVPLIVYDRVIGILAIDSVELGHFGQDHIRLVTPFANQVAVAIENARLFEEMERLKVFNENIVQGVAEAILMVNAEGILTFANPAAEALLGYTREELIGLHWNTLVPENEVDKVQQEATRWLEGLESRYEMTLLCKDGQVVPVIASARPLFEEGKFAGVLAIWIDVTERVQTEEALRQYAAELEASNEELDAFAHTVAHDLKNPLAHIVGFAESLEESYAVSSDKELCRCLHVIGQNGRKMSNIIDELLLLASVRQVQQVKTMSLNIASIVDEAQERLVFLVEEQQAEIVLPGHWPTALGYAPWVEEVWVNYLSNAVKYGGRPPRVELGATEQSDGTVCFWVRDNGPGLTHDQRIRLFTPFTRLNQTRVKGHGLGLSIVRRIVEKLGGQVGVESKVGEGSIFWFTLPAQ